METDETTQRVKTPETVESNVTVHASMMGIWKPDRFDPALGELNEDDKQTIILCRSVTSLLNKLTPENYSTVSEKLKNLSIDTSVRMQRVVEIVHRKAVREWKYRPIYAKVCDEMRDIQVVNELGIEKSFSLYLIGQCETYFVNKLCEDFRFDREKNKIMMCFDQENKISLLKDLKQKEYEFRRDSIGNCKFIGELFKVFMIHPQIIFITLDRLLKANGDVALDCICAILSTIGPFYEEKIGKLPAEYFGKLRSFISNNKLSLRTCFTIQELLDLKKNHWHPRRLPELPKEIRQLDQETVLSESMSHFALVMKQNKTKEIKFHSEWTDISIIYFEHLYEYESSGNKHRENGNKFRNPTGKAHTFEDAVSNILEKLDAENFKPFTKAMKKLPINDGLRLQCIADLIFQYATNKPDKCKLYAEMCSSLQALRVPDRKHLPSDLTILKTLIVNKCQQELDPDITQKVMESKSESNRKSAAICRFIGELFNVEILHVIIMLRCIDKLIKSKDKESLKCLHELLSVAGRNLILKLEQLNRKKEEKELLDKLQNLLEDEKCYLSSETKSVLKDLLSMKKSNESSTRDETNVSTSPIDKPVPVQLPIENHAPMLNSECPVEKQVEKGTSTKIDPSFKAEVTRFVDTASSYYDFTSDLMKKVPECDAMHLQHLVDSIYRKAIDEPGSCKRYAEICHAIGNLSVADKDDSKTKTFRVRLINKCQQQFEHFEIDKAKALDAVKNQEGKLQSSFDEIEREFNRKRIGNCRFIAELSKKQMITMKIILRCATKLLESADDLSLECLCTLLPITREAIEYDPNANPKQHMTKALIELDSRVGKMQLVLDSKTSNVSPRVRSMFQDLANNWGSYKCFKNGLSQLAPETFDSYVEVMDKFQIESVSRLRDIVDFIFNLALDRTGFHKLYAKICRVMLYKTVLDKDRDEILTFKMLLMDKCLQQSERNEVETFDDMVKQKEADFNTDFVDRRNRRECLQKSLNYRRFLAELCALFPDFEKDLKLKKAAQTAKKEVGRLKGEIKITPFPKSKSSEIAPSLKSQEIARVPCVEPEPSKILEVVLEQWKPNEQFPDQLKSIKSTSCSKKLPEAISELIKGVMKTDPSRAEKCGKFFVQLIKENYIQSETIISGLSCFLSSVENQLTISSSLDFIMSPLFESGYLKLDDLNTIFGNNSNTKSIENRENVPLMGKSPPREQVKNTSSSPQPLLQHVTVQKVSSVESFFDPFSTVKNPITSATSSTSNSIIQDPKDDDQTSEKIHQLIRDTVKKHTRGGFNRFEFKRDIDEIPFQKADELKFLAQYIIQMFLEKPDLFVFCAKLCQPIAMVTAEKTRFWMQLMHVCNKYFHRVYFNEDDSLNNRQKPDAIVIRKEEITKKNMREFCRFFALVVKALNNETANVTSQRIMRKLIEFHEIEVFLEIYNCLDWTYDRFENSLFETRIPQFLSSQSGQELEIGLRQKLQQAVENYEIYQTRAPPKKLIDPPALSNKQITDTVDEVLRELLSHPDRLDELAPRLCSMKINNESKLTQVARSICRTGMMNNAKAKLLVELCERMRNWNIIDVKNGNSVSFRDRLIYYLREYRKSHTLQVEIKEYKDAAESDEKNSKHVPEIVINYCRLLCAFLKSPVFGSELFIDDFIDLLLLDPINADFIELLNEFLKILRNDLHLKMTNLENQLLTSSSVSIEQSKDLFEKYNAIFEIITFLQEMINFQKRDLALTDVGSCESNKPETNQTVENRSIVYNRRLNLYLKTNPSVIDKTIKHFEDLCENPARFINSIVVSMCRCFLEEWKKAETIRNIDKEFSSYALLFKIFSQNVPSFGFHCTNALLEFVKNSPFPPGMMSKMLEVLYLYEIMPLESLVRFKNLFVSDKISNTFRILDSIEFQKYKLSQNSDG